MKPVEIQHKSLTHEALLQKAREIPGAWTGLKIAVLLLLKSGYRPNELNKAFGLSRQTMTRWVHQANENGLAALEKTPPPGRPSRLTDDIRGLVEMDLMQAPGTFGLSRGQWSAQKLQKHLKRRYGIDVKIRQARNYFNELKPDEQRKSIKILGREVDL